MERKSIDQSEQPIEEQGQTTQETPAHEAGIEAAVRAGKQIQDFEDLPDTSRAMEFENLKQKAQEYGISTDNLDARRIIIEIVRHETQGELNPEQ